MFYEKKITSKVQQNFKKTWSAPKIISVFIIFSMFIVFSFEQIGLFRKENNLNSQAVYIGKSKYI